MGAFTNDLPKLEFSAAVDSKGRVTIPARIRDRLSIQPGDEIYLGLSPSTLIVEEVGSREEALRFIESFDSLRSFSYEAGVVEVLLCD